MPSPEHAVHPPITRRTALVGSFLAGIAAPAAAIAQSPARFGRIIVDAAPLAARGGGGAAELIQRVMPAKLQDIFRDLIAAGAPGLPTLVVRIDTIDLTGFGDTPAGDAGFHPLDTLTGAGLVIASRHVRSETPLRVTLPPGYSGTWYLPDIDARRIDSLSTQFAYWLRREMQL